MEINKIKFFEYDEIDSTNEEAKRLLRSAKDPAALFGSVVSARRQSAGKGRRGKGFFSPDAGSIYATFILPPPEDFSEQTITPLAAVAVCEAIEKTTSYRPGVKWVNDVLIDGGKVCGILAESIPGAVVLGIGININLPDGALPEDLEGVAVSLQLSDDERTKLFDALVEAVFRCATATGEPAGRLMDDYRLRLSGTP